MTAARSALQKAQSLVNLGRWQQALDELTPALEDSSTAARAHCLLAQSQLALGRRDEAEASALRALALEPELEWGHRLLAIRYLQTRKINRRSIRKALSHAEEAVWLAPRSPHTLHVLARCQLALNQNDRAAATAAVSLEAAPYSSLAHLTAGQVAERRRLLVDAEMHYRDGLEIEPQNSDLSIALANVLRKEGLTDEAADAYLAAGRANPTDSRARRGLARLGVPVIGGIGWLVVKVIVIGGITDLLSRQVRPLEIAAIVSAVIGICATITSSMRGRARRSLPQDIAESLRADHFNQALGWLLVAAILVVPIGIWAAFIPASAGGGAAVAIGLLTCPVIAFMIVGYLWRGATRRPHQMLRRGLLVSFPRLLKRSPQR